MFSYCKRLQNVVYFIYDMDESTRIFNEGNVYKIGSILKAGHALYPFTSAVPLLVASLDVINTQNMFTEKGQ